MNESSDPLDYLFWRDEILQIAYWFQGEGLGEKITAAELQRLLLDDAPALESYLAQMAHDGLLESAGGGCYRLTEVGRKEGGRRFADAFEGLTGQAHGECSADCACHRTGNPADCPSRR